MNNFYFRKIFIACMLFTSMAGVAAFLIRHHSSVDQGAGVNSKSSVAVNVNKPTQHFIKTAASQTVEYTPSKPIYMDGARRLTIRGKSITGGSVPAIALYNCTDIHITANKLFSSGSTGVYLYNCQNITIDHNYITNVSTGVYAEKSQDGGIVADHNQFLNMQGPYPRGQFVQFNGVDGSGNSISFNHCENVEGYSNPEDAISLYKSNGTVKSPIAIKGNWIRGGGPSRSGGGIMLGDNGGSYQLAVDNILVDAGQYGIAISGGDHNSIINNSIYARSRPFTNVGLYVAGYNGAMPTNSTVSGNRVKYFDHTNRENDSWIGPGVEKPSGWETNSWGANIGPAILPSVIVIKN